MTARPPDKPKPRRRWYQFSLRTLLVVVLASGVGLGLVGRKLRQLRSQRLAIQELKQLGVELSVEYGDAGWPYRLLGDDYAPIVSLIWTGERVKVSDASFVHLKALTSLKDLVLQETLVTDAGLQHLKGLTRLDYLNLGGTPVTDAGLVHLQGLIGLERLYLFAARVTDAGLVHLKGLTRLSHLDLGGTQVTGAGIADLRRALPKASISR